MKVSSQQYVYHHNWETVTSAFWVKYPNEFQPHVSKIDTIHRHFDENSPVFYLKRILTLKYNIPLWIQKIINTPAETYAVEEASCDLSKKELRLVSYNHTFSSFVKVREECCYTVHPDNSEWTLYTQNAHYSVVGMGIMCKPLENTIVQIAEDKAKKGLVAMLQKIKKLEDDASRYTEKCANIIRKHTNAAIDLCMTQVENQYNSYANILQHDCAKFIQQINKIKEKYLHHTYIDFKNLIYPYSSEIDVYSLLRKCQLIICQEYGHTLDVINHILSVLYINQCNNKSLYQLSGITRTCEKFKSNNYYDDCGTCKKIYYDGNIHSLILPFCKYFISFIPFFNFNKTQYSDLLSSCDITKGPSYSFHYQKSPCFSENNMFVQLYASVLLWKSRNIFNYFNFLPEKKRNLIHSNLLSNSNPKINSFYVEPKFLSKISDILRNFTSESKNSSSTNYDNLSSESKYLKNDNSTCPSNLERNYSYADGDIKNLSSARHSDIVNTFINGTDNLQSEHSKSSSSIFHGISNILCSTSTPSAVIFIGRYLNSHVFF